MRRLAWIAVGVSVLACVGFATAAENVDLLAPEPSTQVYRIDSLVLDWRNQGVHLYLFGDNGTRKTCSWDGATAVTLMTALNKANLSVKSLVRRAYEQAQTSGCLPVGTTISGLPD